MRGGGGYDVYNRIFILMTATVISLMIGSGCTTRYTVDLAADREINAADDLELLKPQESVTVPEPLTLEAAVRFSFEHNLEMRINRIMARIDDDKALAKNLEMLPDFTLQAAIEDKSDYLRASISEERTQKTADLTLAWNLLDFGISYIRARQAALQNEVRRMERLRQAQTLALDIAGTFFKAAMAERDLERVRTVEEQMRRYLEKASEMVAQNRLDPIVAKDIEKKLTEMAITVGTLQADLSGAKYELAKLMGLPAGTDLVLADGRAENWIEDLPELDALDPMALERISLHNRPEFFAADLNSRIQHDEARAALVQMFPSIRFDLAGHYNGNDSYVTNEWATVGAGLMYNFLALPARYMEWNAQVKAETKVRLERLLLTGSVIAQTHLALHEYTVKTRHFKLNDEAFRVSAELLDMTAERHALGTLSDTEITERMQEHIVTTLKRNQSLIDLIHAYHTLLVTLGLDYYRWETPLADQDPDAAPMDIGTRNIMVPDGVVIRPAQTEPAAPLPAAAAAR